MKKHLLTFIFLLIPVFCAAQTEGKLTKDYFGSILDIATPLKFDDKMYVLAANIDNKKTQILGVDENLSKVWSATVDGYAKNVFKFKGRVLVIAKMDSVAKKSNALFMVYKAYVFDAVTGKVLMAKQLCKLASSNTVIYFTGSPNGAYLKMVVREYVPKGSALRTSDEGTDIGLSYAERQTKTMTITDFDDNLKPATVFYPKTTANVFLGLICNNAGTLFLSGYASGAINIQKYMQGSTQTSSELNLPIGASSAKSPGVMPAYLFIASAKNPDAVYASAFSENAEKQHELNVYKADFDKNTVIQTKEVFTEDHLKALLAAYKPFNASATKLRELSTEMDIRFIIEHNDRLIVSLASTYQLMGYAGTDVYHQISFEGSSLLIKGFDLDVNPIYSQILPSNYKSSVRDGEVLPAAYPSGKLLQVIDGYSAANNVMIGTMDTGTGTWTDLKLLPKTKLGGQDVPMATAILWYVKGFVVPFVHQGGVFKKSENISFQQFLN